MYGVVNTYFRRIQEHSFSKFGYSQRCDKANSSSGIRAVATVRKALRYKFAPVDVRAPIPIKIRVQNFSFGGDPLKTVSCKQVISDSNNTPPFPDVPIWRKKLYACNDART